MDMQSQKNWIMLVIASFLIWFSTIYSVPLIIHLYSVLFRRDALQDGQYEMIFFFGSGLGSGAGIIPAALTIALSWLKPNFAPIACWIALGYIAFWTVTTINCEAAFVRDWLGGGVLMTLMALTLLLPAMVFSLPLVILDPELLLFGLPYSLPLVFLLLIAFYFTPSRGFHLSR